MPKEQDSHDRLYGYVILLVFGLIILVDGLSTLPSGWVAALLGAGLSAFGGFEVKITYNRIQIEENNSVQAKQTGKKSSQVNQTSPTNSPAIGRARDVYIVGGEPRQPKRKKEVAEVVTEKPNEQFEWLCNGEIHIDRYEEFEARMNKGDRIEGHVESENPVTVQIMSQKDYDTLAGILENEIDEDEEYNSYYSTPNTTSYDFSWTSTVNRTVIVVVSGGTEDDEGQFTATVTARIKITRSAGT